MTDDEVSFWIDDHGFIITKVDYDEIRKLYICYWSSPTIKNFVSWSKSTDGIEPSLINDIAECLYIKCLEDSSAI